MSAIQNGVRLNDEDLLEMPDDGKRYEVIWIVDVEAQKLTALRLNSGVYAVEAEPAGDEIFRPALFPGLEIPLAKVCER